jgi:peptide chain release factor 3
VQTFSLRGAAAAAPLLGAVGPLQFDVLEYRLNAEYGAKSKLEPAPWRVVRWVSAACVNLMRDDMLMSGARLAQDESGRLVVLFVEEWDCAYFLRQHPEISLLTLPPDAVFSAPNND